MKFNLDDLKLSYFIIFILGCIFYFISSCEVKALSAGPSGYNNMYTNKGARYSLSAGLETIDGVTYYLGHTKRGDITTLQFAIDNLSGTSNDYNVSFNIIVHGLFVNNPSVTINEYNSLNFGQSCTIVSENISHPETDYTLYNANVTCSAISLSKNYMVTIGGFENITYGGISPSITYSQSTGNYDQKLDDVNDSINNVGDKVTGAIEGDNLDTGSIESSKNDTFDSYKEAEGNLNLDGADLSGINLGLNPTVAKKSWSVMDSLLNTNPKLLTFIISLLSIGLIKLFLGR